MKKISIIHCLSFSMALSIHGQNAMSSAADISTAQKFFSYFLQVKNLQRDVEKLTEREKEMFNYQKGKVYKLDSLTIKQYSFIPVVTDSTRVFAQVDLVTIKNRIHYRSLSYRIEKRGSTPLETDSNFLHKLISNQIINPATDGFARERNTFRFIYMEPQIVQYLENISTLLEKKELVYLYTASFFFKPFYDKKWSFANPSPDGVISVKEILLVDDYKALTKLYRTPSKVFNWYIAEQVYYYGKQRELPMAIKTEVSKFNGQRGFPKFRDMNTLKSIYN